MTDYTQAREALERYGILCRSGGDDAAFQLAASEPHGIAALVASLDAEIAELEARMAWQPIETAPKDGTWVLLCGGEIDDIHWAASDIIGIESHPHVVSAAWDGRQWTTSSFDSGETIQYDSPSHWMPLPEPPEGA